MVNISIIFLFIWIFLLGAISNNVQRHENILRWAVNLTRDCDIVETRFRYLRPGINQINLFSFLKYHLDGTQQFDIIPSSYQHLQNDGGNLRYQINNSELIKSRYNTNRLTNYQNSNVNDLSERRIYHDRAAAKIQAAYRGYSVRKSLPWLNDRQKNLDDEFNQRVKKKKDHFRNYFSFFI